VEFAKYLNENNLTFAEFYRNFLEKKKQEKLKLIEKTSNIQKNLKF
jgi:hypothetical protein